MKSTKEAFLEELNGWVEEGLMERRIHRGRPLYRLTPLGQALAREEGMSPSDGDWRSWREIWELGNDEVKELDDPVPSRQETRAAVEELVAKGLVERFRRSDGEIAYRCVDSGTVSVLATLGK